MMDTQDVIKNPLSTEKSIRLLEEQGWLVFEVQRKARKPDIKKAVEELYNVKVNKINTLITNKGKKRAFVRLSDKDSAMDLATRLGLM